MVRLIESIIGALLDHCHRPLPAARNVADGTDAADRFSGISREHLFSKGSFGAEGLNARLIARLDMD
jgi:hypothetical protein